MLHCFNYFNFWISVHMVSYLYMYTYRYIYINVCVQPCGGQKLTSGTFLSQISHLFICFFLPLPLFIVRASQGTSLSQQTGWLLSTRQPLLSSFLRCSFAVMCCQVWILCSCQGSEFRSPCLLNKQFTDQHFFPFHLILYPTNTVVFLKL